MELEALNRKAAANNEINWVTAIAMGLFHVGAIVALFFFTWKALFVAMFLWWVSGSLGIGMGYQADCYARVGFQYGYVIIQRIFSIPTDTGIIKIEVNRAKHWCSIIPAICCFAVKGFVKPVVAAF